MSARASGEIKTRIVHNAQKNGAIYILERKTIYDVDKKWNKALGAKLLSKIPKGSKIPVQTRPKKPHLDKEAKSTKEITASRDHVGMMELIDHIGSASGIDDGLYSNTDLGAARKIISIARYPLATKRTKPARRSHVAVQPFAPLRGWDDGGCLPRTIFASWTR